MNKAELGSMSVICSANSENTQRLYFLADGSLEAMVRAKKPASSIQADANPPQSTDSDPKNREALSSGLYTPELPLAH